MSKPGLVISECLENLEDTKFTNHAEVFNALILILQEKNCDVAPKEVVRILAALEKCMEDEVQSIPLALSVVLSLLTNVQNVLKIQVQDLIQSALTVMKILNTVCTSKTEFLKCLAMKVFLAYPDDILVEIIKHNCSEVINTCELLKPPCAQNAVEPLPGLDKTSFFIVRGLLSKLPAEEKKQFVELGIPIWFSDLLPYVMTDCSMFSSNDDYVEYLEVMETITDALADIDYFNHPQWNDEVLKSICNTKKYPALIHQQLLKDNNTWYRIWIVIVKLLNTQITVNSKYGTPIQSLLGVVESAFKIEEHKVNSFKCWDTLINCLSSDANTKCLQRYIKLLLIPLKVNNAKNDIIARAKLFTWWNIIRKFQSKLNQFTDEVVISFLHFAFGKPEYSKSCSWSCTGLSHSSIHMLCLQVLVQIVGHNENCQCCSDLPHLNEKILTNKLLASHWDDWMVALKVAIQMSCKILANDTTATNGPLQVLCVWRAFVMSIAELPPNGIRKDMFNALLKVLIDFVQSAHNIPGSQMSSILFPVTLSLTEQNDKIRSLLLSKGQDQALRKVVSILMDRNMRDVYERYNTEKMVHILKPLTYLIVESLNTDWLVDFIKTQESISSIKMSTALAHSLNETSKQISLKTLSKFLIEMFIKAEVQKEVEPYTATVWHNLYSANVDKLCNTGFVTNIALHLQEDEANISYFKLVVSLSLLKQQLIKCEDIDVNCKKLRKIIATITRNYKKYEPAIPILVDILVLVINNLNSKNIDEDVAQIAMDCVKNALQMIFADIKSQTENHIMFIMLKILFEEIGQMYEVTYYTKICCEFHKFLTEHTKLLNKDSSLYKFILSRISSLKRNPLIVTPKATAIEDSIKALQKNQIELVTDNTKTIRKNIEEFTSPNVKVVKKSKKKETSIVDTVVENGEEYVVVKSNWKFHPRKLTENQKEKLQRKREDIPALYQDLSQSQDEFKLQSWKTDSQDTTISTNSQSSKLNVTNNEDALNILKDIESSDIVPNIIKNIMCENNKNHNVETSTTNSKCEKQSTKSTVVTKLSPVTPKNTKSPRMALKDRVLRNVRNLIETSPHRNETGVDIVAGGQIHDAPKTPPPVEQKDNINHTKSAPSVISVDRPSRIKRKPKKFEDIEFFELKKTKQRRSSLTDTLPNTQSRLNISIKGKKRRLSQYDEIKSTENFYVCVNDDVNGEKKSNETHISEADSSKIENESEIIALKQYGATQDKSLILDKTITNDAPSNNGNKRDFQTENNFQNNGNYLDCKHNENQYTTNGYPNSHKSEIQNIKKLVVAEDVKNEKLQQFQNSKQNGQIKNTVKNVEIDENHQNINPENRKVDIDNGNDNNNKDENLKTPVRKIEQTSQKSSKKSSTKQSRIEKKLAIDMVEGHPILKIHSEKRLTRKKLLESENGSESKSLPGKPSKLKMSPRGSKMFQEKNQPVTNCKVIQSSSLSVEDSQGKNISMEDPPCSEDVIESSQDSTFTTISAKSTKITPKRVPVVNIEKLDLKSKTSATQDLIQDSDCEVLCESNKSVNQDSKDDIELPLNKTAVVDVNCDSTENMDTEPVADDKQNEVVIILDDDELPIIVSSEKGIGLETQELAEADTQPNDPALFAELESTDNSPDHLEIANTAMDVTEAMSPNKYSSENTFDSQKKRNESLNNCSAVENDVGSPFKDDVQRKQDFLNNTSELSPIKIQSPDKDKTSPEKKYEPSCDYLIVKLTSPVHSNGEPYRSGSPEFFTEDKISPDKRDKSPPRAEANASSVSPSSSLSLKRNRPQAMRPGGRAAHMLDLCIPDSRNTIKHLEISAPEEPKKINASTPAKQNLRMLYYAVSDNSNSLEEEEPDNFLKLKKALPSVDSSPSVPILKRKIDLVEDNTASPAGKRKRVSFHDPPVSTTVSVQKYIENLCKSPSSRSERPMLRTYKKSPRRVDSAFKLDTILSKAVESFKEPTDSLTYDTNSSLDITPAVEVVNTSELNDKDPICPDLVDCTDSIENIALELSSPAMKILLIKELNGKVVTIGDLAKMTELEVNRLCIKAPKVQVAKKVLADYVHKKKLIANDVKMQEAISLDDQTAIATEMDSEMTESEQRIVTVETQTDLVSKCDVFIQTTPGTVKLVCTQTDGVFKENASIQTTESSFKKTSEVISSCLSERPDFVKMLGETLSTDNIIGMVANISTDSNLKQIISKILDCQGKNMPNDKRKCMESTVLKEILCERLDSKELIIFCSSLLLSVHDKMA